MVSGEISEMAIDAARALLPAMVWEYIAGGSGDEVTLRGNRIAPPPPRLAFTTFAPAGGPSDRSTRSPSMRSTVTGAS